MRRSIVVTSVIFLATALASSTLILSWSGVSEAEPASGTAELTGAPVSTDPSKKTPEADVLPELKEEPPDYSQVVDSSEGERFSSAGWRKQSGKPRSYGEDYRVATASGDAEAARYKVKVPATDVYSVFVWWPEKLSQKASARIGVETVSGVEWSTVDQSKDGGYWVPVGQYEMEEGDDYKVQIAPDSENGGVAVADAVTVVRGVLSFPPDTPEEKVGGASADEEVFSGAASSKAIPPRKIINRSRNHVGTPYGNRRCIARKQEDCECFTRLVFRKWKSLPKSPKWQWRKGRKVSRSNLRRGDLVFFDIDRNGSLGHWDHVGIFAGNGYLIHANNYYKYQKVHWQKMKYVPGYWGAKRLRHK